MSDNVTSSRLPTVRHALTAIFCVIGALLTLYLALATLGFISSSSVYYSNYILGTVAMAGLIAIRDLLDEWPIENLKRLLGFHTRMAIAVIGTILSVVGSAYVRLEADRLEVVQPFFEQTDIIMGMILTVGILMLTLLHWGWLITLVIVISIVYLFFGHLLTSPLFTHPHYDIGFAMNYMGLGTSQGFFWFAQTAADQLYFLVIFAGVLLGLGILQMVLEVGKLSGKHISGGAAVPAIVGSAVVSSVMGQSVSNVIMTGRFTIPMMKRYGYSPSMAGAIEASASTAGQITPPILGLAGFIIAAFLNVPYVEVALASLIPCLLFMFGNTFSIFAYAGRNSLPKMDLPADTRLILRVAPTFVVSFTVVLVLLLLYYSPAIAGMAGIITAFAMCLFQGQWRPTCRGIFLALEEGLMLITILALLLIAIGPLGQVMMTTNFSGRLGTVLLEFMPDNAYLLLIGAMVVSLILGMGLPSPVAYVIGALAMVPFMQQQLGVPALQAHFFIFYFAVYSAITPPVMVSVLAAAKIAKCGQMACFWDSLKLSACTFIIPFAFIYSPELMAFPNINGSMIVSTIEILVIQVLLAIAIFGYLFRSLTALERAVFGMVAMIGLVVMTNPENHSIALATLLYGGTIALCAYAFLSRHHEAVKPAPIRLQPTDAPHAD